MTRLRARGGVRDRPPIIDEDDDDIFNPVPTQRKRKVVRKEPKERVEKEKPEKERVEKIIDRERDVTQDETSLYFIIRHSKASIAVISNYFINL